MLDCRYCRIENKIIEFENTDALISHISQVHGRDAGNVEYSKQFDESLEKDDGSVRAGPPLFDNDDLTVPLLREPVKIITRSGREVSGVLVRSNFEFLQVATDYEGLVLISRETIEIIEETKSIERIYASDEVVDDGSFDIDNPIFPS